jgi:hypothetical protein
MRNIPLGSAISIFGAGIGPIIRFESDTSKSEEENHGSPNHQEMRQRGLQLRAA